MGGQKGAKESMGGQKGMKKTMENKKERNGRVRRINNKIYIDRITLHANKISV
jgi:hypothetical protein